MFVGFPINDLGDCLLICMALWCNMVFAKSGCLRLGLFLVFLYLFDLGINLCFHNDN